MNIKSQKKMSKELKTESYNCVKTFYDKHKQEILPCLKKELEDWLETSKKEIEKTADIWVNSDIFIKARKFTIREGHFRIFKLGGNSHKIANFGELLKNILRIHKIRTKHEYNK